MPDETHGSRSNWHPGRFPPLVAALSRPASDRSSQGHEYPRQAAPPPARLPLALPTPDVCLRNRIPRQSLPGSARTQPGPRWPIASAPPSVASVRRRSLAPVSPGAVGFHGPMCRQGCPVEAQRRHGRPRSRSGAVWQGWAIWAQPRSLPAVWHCATPRGGRSVLDVDAVECDCFHRSD